MPSGIEKPDTYAQASLDLVENSTLKTLIPASSCFNINDRLYNPDGSIHKDVDFALSTVPQRKVLFFDETVDVYVILQTRSSSEKILRSNLERLTIIIEGQVKTEPSEARDSTPGYETILNKSIQGPEYHSFVVQTLSEVENTSLDPINIIWKVSTFLVRPRFRLQNTSIIFAAKAILRPLSQSRSDDKYLPTHVPSAINMLEAFSDDPSIPGVKPQLSSLRVSRVTPTIQAALESSRPLKNISRQSMPVHPVINARVKYSRLSTTPKNIGLIASVEIDTTPFTDCRITLTQVKLELNGGIVEDLSAKSGLSLPTVTLPQDNITFLYYLNPEELDSNTALRDLFIHISATVDLSSICQPRINMRWTTSISFTPPVNPGFGTPTLSIKRSHKPTQLSIDYSSTDAKKSNSYPTVNRSKSLTAKLNHQRNSTEDLGITMTFISSPSSIYPGIPFAWTLFIANRSNRTRKLTLTVNSKCRSITTDITQDLTIPQLHLRDHDIAEAVLDEKLIHGAHKASIGEATEIICLSTDQVIGPLAPMACHEVELKFLALRSGVLSIDVIRIIDFDTQEQVDIRNLPTINVSSVKNGSSID
ncbi:hypothetical protein K3495_g3836 [Podosphaera aphanis]|nr:hypothetical protein K3495_g3836 [Podosphaera aphanis]